ncbi:HSP20 type chaperone [Halarchaeum acidiphilum MH1-52-1]|uniref:HSP20 type chaperone n=1 Tax=Halarchaeum acidiphilum MH1-52-1 TaxID=1261545 RepID=U3A796_9EURY|nr:Hsp20/alpha crystallin family protein [Halarchaeum acidiphilum]GAD53554.1 HSP20 type chaperone [Halarchaeum acidiphilum MH1-52-1]
MTRLREALRGLPDAVFVDLLESDDAYRLVFDLPGVRADALTLDVQPCRLHVDARRAKDVPDAFRYEREERALFVEFDVPLPPNATADGAAATLGDGVLDVTIPKAGGDAATIPVEE